jgi:signal transduction histidine kinase
MEYVMQSNDIKKTLENAVKEVEGLIIKKKLNVQIEDMRAIEQSTFDNNRIMQVLNNLLSNAIKFSPDNARITISCKVDNENMTIKITDQGMGIPMADQIHLFERFFRATNATNIQGTGLGLHIVGRYIEILSGTISYESELEKGSTFKIVLPSIKRNDFD